MSITNMVGQRVTATIRTIEGEKIEVEMLVLDMEFGKYWQTRVHETIGEIGKELTIHGVVLLPDPPKPPASSLDEILRLLE